MNKYTKKYYKDIYHLFPSHIHQEKKFLNQLKNELEKYSFSSYEDCLEEFGDPQDIVDAYYERIDNSFIISKMRHRKLLKIAIIFFISILIITVLWKAFHMYMIDEEIKDNSPVYVEETIVDGE